jgi:hypothetical protein
MLVSQKTCAIKNKSVKQKAESSSGSSLTQNTEITLAQLEQMTPVQISKLTPSQINPLVKKYMVIPPVINVPKSFRL